MAVGGPGGRVSGMRLKKLNPERYNTFSRIGSTNPDVLASSKRVIAFTHGLLEGVLSGTIVSLLADGKLGYVQVDFVDA
jgi:hypothetical protein